MNNDILNMRLHQEIYEELTNGKLQIIRVPNGWIYNYIYFREYNKMFINSILVPDKSKGE